MPEPIKVDFRKKRPAPKPNKPAPHAYRPGGSGEKAVNWRALPKFLLFVLAMMLLFAGLNWGMKAIGLGG